MAITEHRRNQLHNRAHEALGVEEGDALMELLPPVGWGDVATRRDVTDVRRDMDNHVTALRHEIARSEERLRTEMAQHQEQTHKDFGEVYKAMSKMMWTMTVSMIGTVVASAGFAFTAGVAL